MLYLKIIIIILLFFINFVEQQKPQNISSSKNNFLKHQFIQQFRSKTSNSIIINNTTKRLKFNSNSRRIPEG
uniref:Candidate secreted effector n=1 Tax=Meloidogyne incognita TaxID=6306 RepID=A0A914MBQ9_MELIC